MTDLPVTVLLDTNFLLVPIRFGVDVFAEAERVLNQLVDFAVTPNVLGEVERLRSEAQPGFRSELDFALKVASRCKVIDAEPEEGETVDNSIVRLAASRGYVVATTDAELRRRLREVGVKVLILRQKRYLQLMG
ncbi:MAG TPA: DNA-binding protein [Candidatus Bathyarchaeia archaeon]